MRDALCIPTRPLRCGMRVIFWWQSSAFIAPSFFRHPLLCITVTLTSAVVSRGLLRFVSFRVAYFNRKECTRVVHAFVLERLFSPASFYSMTEVWFKHAVSVAIFLFLFFCSGVA